jgi:hypothetical protein
MYTIDMALYNYLNILAFLIPFPAPFNYKESLVIPFFLPRLSLKLSPEGSKERFGASYCGVK